MGMKAVEALLDANQTDITVVSRNPAVSAERAPFGRALHDDIVRYVGRRRPTTRPRDFHH